MSKKVNPEEERYYKSCKYRYECNWEGKKARQCNKCSWYKIGSSKK